MSGVKNDYMKDLAGILVNVNEKTLKELNRYLSFFNLLKTVILRRVVGKPYLYKHFLKGYENIKEISETIHQNVLPSLDSVKEDILSNIRNSDLPAESKEAFEQNMISWVSDLQRKLIPIPYRLKTMEEITVKMKDKVDNDESTLLLDLDLSLIGDTEEGKEELRQFSKSYDDIRDAINEYYAFIKAVDKLTGLIKVT
ncbi:MAG: hypothetical protein WC875_04645 [Candidatus Absconditabacterales bacterium]